MVQGSETVWWVGDKNVMKKKTWCISVHGACVCTLKMQPMETGSDQNWQSRMILFYPASNFAKRKS